MKIPLFQVDAFTHNLFSGNPAAVCILEQWIDDQKLRAIAAENNLSETAFCVKKEKDQYELRWFTPVEEIDLCGHATLATAFVITNHVDRSLDKVSFQTKSGVLYVERNDQFFTLNFPSREPQNCETPANLIKALGIEPREVLASRDYLVVYNSEEEVISLSPDMHFLKTVDRFGVIVTAASKRADFVSRFFAPKAGINEDPVTGSAHCTLVPYWAKKLSKPKLHALQISQRGGELFCEDRGKSVKISGKAKLYLKGEIFID